MNQRKSREIRKIVYGNQKPNTKYVRLKSTGQVMNVGDMEKVSDSFTKQSRNLPKRRIYRYLKKIAKGLKIKDLRRVFLNENTESNNDMRTVSASEV